MLAFYTKSARSCMNASSSSTLSTRSLPPQAAGDFTSAECGEKNDGGRNILIGREFRSFLREVRLAPFHSEIPPEAVKRDGFWPVILKRKGSAESVKASGRKRQSGTALTIELGGWINLPYGVETTVALVVEYQDEGVPVSFKVDAARSRGATQLLLTGTVDIVSNDPVSTIKIYCYGIDDKSVWIENFQFKIL